MGWKRKVNIVLIIGLITYLNFNIYLQNRATTTSTNRECSSTFENEKQRLSHNIKNVLKIIRKIKSTLSSNEPDLNTYEANLQSLLSEFHQENYSVQRKIKTNPLKYSCPETYNGSTFGYPYFIKGFVREKCKRPAISKTVTLILDRPIINVNFSSQIINYSVKYFKQIFIITEEKHKLETKSLSGSIILFFITKHKTVGQNLELITSLVTSPYILVAPHLHKFDNTSDVERLIHVHEISGADVIASATKHIETGEWERGCYQSHLQMYILKYTAGYHRSKYECLYCDHVTGPFLIERSLLLNIKFRKISHGVYKDFFLRLKDVGKKTLVCPDVMFYVHTIKENSNDLSKFANIRMIQKLDDGRGKSLTLMSRLSFLNSIAVPYSGRQNLANDLKSILKLCYANNIQCELQEGTLMGAVKFNHVLPWERDADITVLSSDFVKFKDLFGTFKKQGLVPVLISDVRCCFEGVITGGIINIQAHGWVIEVYGQHKLTSHDQPTKIRFANDLVPVPENPGLYIRNRYGHEIYKHAEHWMATGKKSGWDKYESGDFVPCIKTGNHACLDQFNGDGDIQFHDFL